MLIVPIFERQAAGRLSQLGRGHRRRRQRCSACIARCTSRTIRCSTRSTTSRRATRRGLPTVWKTRYATIGVLICWDQWYPEAARITACSAPQVLFYPTAIGWHPAEKDEWGAAQVDAWRTMQRAHAIANGVYVASPNRIGHEDEPGTDGITFFGHSFIADPFGRYVAEAGERRERSSSRAATRRSSKTSAATGRSCATAASTPTARSSSATSADDRRPAQPRWRMPAEWEPHRATWIAWPHHEPDWPGKLAPIPWVYAEIARVLADFEPVEILCHAEAVCESARRHPRGARRARRSRPPAPRARPIASGCATARRPASSTPPAASSLLNWAFNAWAKYDNWRAGRAGRPRDRATSRGLPRVEPTRPDNGARDRARRRRHRDQRRGPAARHRGVAAERRPGAQPGADARRLRARCSREWLGIAQDDLARRRLRRRRHARPRRRHRAVRRARHDRARGRGRSGRREPRASMDNLRRLRARRARSAGRTAARRQLPFPRARR